MFGTMYHLGVCGFLSEIKAGYRVFTRMCRAAIKEYLAICQHTHTLADTWYQT
jgi:hypothetical protein